MFGRVFYDEKKKRVNVNWKAMTAIKVRTIPVVDERN
jgi:hypothetical protein